ncbi:type II secretion system GspH family protein [Candidatus Pacebacteria bacterium]|nr:type II secretion system GspH family protein [Candidatus Paceibacterota bacterium]
MNKEKLAQRGFTLTELLVVVSIISLLTTSSLTFLGEARNKARDSVRITEINEISKALELYHFDHGHYPPESGNNVYYDSRNSGHWSALSAFLVPEYLPLLPVDPKNGGAIGICGNCGEYHYRKRNNTYTLSTYLESEDHPNKVGFFFADYYSVHSLTCESIASFYSCN